jgi:hypothetical protein
MDKIPFYERLGFRQDQEFIVLNGKGFSSPQEPAVRKAERPDIDRIIEYDSRCFGASRRKLLEPILLDPDNMCFFQPENKHIAGYVLAKVYRGMAELGPLACQQDRSDVAISLLRTALSSSKGLEVSIFIPEREQVALNVLRKAGFTENFRVARMLSGPSPFGNCVLTAESLERG